MHLTEILVDLKRQKYLIFYGQNWEITATVVRRELRVQPHQFPWFKTSLGMMQGRAGNWKKKGWYFSRTFLSIPSNYIRKSLIYLFFYIPASQLSRKKKSFKLSWMEFF